jgi:hypothetical protein
VTDLCPSCREPLDHPSGDGCAAMTKHQHHQYPSPEAIVRAALERAAIEVEVLTGACVDPHVKVWAENQAQSIRLLADNDAEVAAILLKAAGEDRG